MARIGRVPEYHEQPNLFRELLFWLCVRKTWRDRIRAKMKNLEYLNKRDLAGASSDDVSRAIDTWRSWFFFPRSKPMNSVRWIVR